MNPRRPSSRRVARGGFTLLEILLALALTALMLVALNTFVFSMGELWGRNGDVRLFDQHVRSVTRFLGKELRRAGLPPARAGGEAPFVAMEIRPQGGMSENMLTFGLPEGNRLLNWPDRPLPEVVCSLQARPGAGLFLLWHSKLEKRFSDDPPRETLVTPFVRSMTYDYYDPEFKRWKTENALMKDNDGQLLAPQRLRLQFSYGTLTRESVITLGGPGEGLPNF